MTDALRTELDALPFEELRARAFSLAEKKHDVGFFWDLAKHLPASDDAAGDDSFSGPGTTIADFLELWRELRGKGKVGEDALLRAKFVDYLASHQR